MHLIDLSGKTFGHLTVLWRAEVESRDVMWCCRCSCGSEKNIAGGSLRHGLTISCGCHRSQVTTRRNAERATHGHTRGRSRTPEYQSWRSMRERCNNPSAINYDLYGGRGVRVAPEWDDFEAFLADMGPRPANTSLDRIDPNGDYETRNCRWTDATTQNRNQRRHTKPAPFAYSKAGKPIFLIAGGSGEGENKPDPKPDDPPKNPPDDKAPDDKTPDPKAGQGEDFWKSKSREWEKRAKDNADAAKRLAEMEEAQKTEQQKLTERAEAAERAAKDRDAENLRLKVAIAKNLPADLADRLRGDSEEELNEDADKLLALVKADPKTPKPDPAQGAKPGKPGGGLEEGREKARARFAPPKTPTAA